MSDFPEVPVVDSLEDEILNKKHFNKNTSENKCDTTPYESKTVEDLLTNNLKFQQECKRFISALLATGGGFKENSLVSNIKNTILMPVCSNPDDDEDCIVFKFEISSLRMPKKDIMETIHSLKNSKIDTDIVSI